MAKLCLGVASNDLPAVDQGPIVTRLLFAAKLQNSLGEHLHVQCHWTSPRETEVPRVVLAFLVRVIRDHMAELWVGQDHLVAIPPLLELLKASLLVEVFATCNLRMLFDKIDTKLHLLANIGGDEHFLSLYSVESASSALLDQLWVDNLTLDAATELFRIEDLLLAQLDHFFLG